MLVWFALVFPLLLGMAGLVIDAGLLMASRRNLQNAVDGASLAGAHAIVQDQDGAEAEAMALQFLTARYGLDVELAQAYSPPQNGPYAGEEGYVEVIAELETSTLLIHLLPGAAKTRKAVARAVAGSESRELLDAVFALDANARPGLSVTGNAQLNVTGRIVVNSEGGGIGADGNPVASQAGGWAGFVSPFSQVTAPEVYMVGGVNRVDRFINSYPQGPSPLKTGQLPLPDPLIHLPTPKVANGVVDIRRGAPVATPDRMMLNNPLDLSDTPNEIVTNSATGEQTMVLRPGIYSSISISGGRVRFEPGIYVLAANAQTDFSLQVTAGQITADGIMFYNTTEEYDPVTGLPDQMDQNADPNGNRDKRQMRINANLGFTPINTAIHSYPDASPFISQFNGVMIYQRRRNNATMQIQGFSGVGDLQGTVYAKWAQVRLPAGGVFNSQFVVGSLSVPGHGDLTIDHRNQDLAQAPQIYLVE